MANKQEKKDAAELKHFITRIERLDKYDNKLAQVSKKNFDNAQYRHIEKDFDKAYNGIDPAGVTTGAQFADLLGVGHDHGMDALLQHLLNSN